MNKYKPGASVHLTATALQLGLLADPPTIACTVHFPNGTTLTPAVTRDSTGTYHTDIAIDFAMPEGVGVYRWQATGSAPSQNALREVRFVVLPLDF